MNADVQWTCNELIRGLIEGGAHGGLIIGLIWMCLTFFFPQANAATRHGAWFATIVIAALLPAAIFLGALFKRIQPEAKPTLAQSAITAPINEPQPGEFSTTEEWESEPTLALPDLAAEPSVPAVAPGPNPGFAWRLAIPNYISVTLVACWIALAATRLAVLAAQLLLLRRIKQTALIAPETLRASFYSIVHGMAISRNPRLLISERAIAPMVVGFFRPAMLLPKLVAERCTAAQLEHLFRHELAHLARRDDWTNLLQQVIAAIYFFHPGIILVSRRLTAEREIACDDHALALRRAPREYALFLTEFASQMKGRDFTAAPAAWSSRSQLKERIGMILNGKRNASPRVSRSGVGAIAATAATFAIAAVILTPPFVVAAEEPEALPVPETQTIPVTTAVDVAVAVEPVAVPVPAISTETAPSGVTIASVTSGPRRKDPLDASLNVYVAPKTLQVAPMKPVGPLKIVGLPQPEPEPRPRYKPGPRPDRDDGDVEHRIERLERMVEELLKRDKQARDENGSVSKKNFNQDWNLQFRSEFDKAHREAERAQRDAERSVREQKMAMENIHIDHQRIAQIANRESLKARRQALESQRKQIEQELQAVQREIEKSDAERDKRNAEKEAEKRNKADEKEKEKQEKKARDRNKDSDDSDKAK